MNYFYGWTSLPHAKPQFVPVSSLDPLGFLYNVSPDRVHKIGGSFDYNAYKIPLLNIENVVFRGEFLGTINNQFYGNVQPKTLVARFQKHRRLRAGDRQIRVWHPVPCSGNRYSDPGQWADSSGFHSGLESAKRRAHKSWRREAERGQDEPHSVPAEHIYGATTNFRVSVFYSDAGEWWFRPRAIYDVSDNITAELGGQFFMDIQMTWSESLPAKVCRKYLFS